RRDRAASRRSARHRLFAADRQSRRCAARRDRPRARHRAAAIYRWDDRRAQGRDADPCECRGQCAAGRRSRPASRRYRPDPRRAAAVPRLRQHL
ncbi:hypothetical protein LTR94_036586, partial [Friedmanniomyces endolithicus]